MVDIAFGPEQGPRPDLTDHRAGYLEMARRKRMYGGILLLLFVAMMASGCMLADDRNAGGLLERPAACLRLPVRSPVGSLGRPRQPAGHPGRACPRADRDGEHRRRLDPDRRAGRRWCWRFCPRAGSRAGRA